MGEPRIQVIVIYLRNIYYMPRSFDFLPMSMRGYGAGPEILTGLFAFEKALSSSETWT